MTTLDRLKKGERARIVDVAGHDAVSTRLMEMGLIEGEEIELLNFAPLGDPVEYLVRGYRLSLRISEARLVAIERLQEAGSGSPGP
jgi:ferrous iron transport protein A